MRKEQAEPAAAAGSAALTDYDHLLSRRESFVKRQYEGKVVVWPQDREMQSTKQGRLRYYLNTNHLDTCLPEWAIKVQEIPERSGKHRHQGGVIIFVLDGEGTTVVDGEPFHWEAGDLVVLPLKPGGVVHQHFNRPPDGTPARWAAYSHDVVKDLLGGKTEQLEMAPTWQAVAQGDPTGE
jgi:mannose-6-phosphate isomerase-like protein (cupin superfamily)